jgi:hypothetical protein
MNPSPTSPPQRALVRNSAGHAPPRVPGSVRRTSSIDVNWPEGRAGNMRMVGRARDVYTPSAGGAPVVCAEDSFEAAIRQDRSIVAIDATPARPALARLVGERGGGHLRKVLAELVPEERRRAAPLYLILDDLSGVSLIAGFAWICWNPNWMAEMRALMADPATSKVVGPREGVCIGFAPGSSALEPRTEQNLTPVVDLRHPDDPNGWHAFTAQDGSVGMRRARRIDVQLGDVISIDAAFQDSATMPGGGRAAVHEYRLRVTADATTMRLLSVEPEPRILPFVECPSAVINAKKLAGSLLADLRETVLAELRGTAGCTHLNDAMRALAEVPALVERLRRQQSG